MITDVSHLNLKNSKLSFYSYFYNYFKIGQKAFKFASIFIITVTLFFLIPVTIIIIANFRKMIKKWRIWRNNSESRDNCPIPIQNDLMPGPELEPDQIKLL